jgi:hypothetical protein
MDGGNSAIAFVFACLLLLLRPGVRRRASDGWNWIGWTEAVNHEDLELVSTLYFEQRK